MLLRKPHYRPRHQPRKQPRHRPQTGRPRHQVRCQASSLNHHSAPSSRSHTRRTIRQQSQRARLPVIPGTFGSNVDWFQYQSMTQYWMSFLSVRQAQQNFAVHAPPVAWVTQIPTAAPHTQTTVALTDSPPLIARATRVANRSVDALRAAEPYTTDATIHIRIEIYRRPCLCAQNISLSGAILSPENTRAASTSSGAPVSRPDMQEGWVRRPRWKMSQRACR